MLNTLGLSKRKAMANENGDFRRLTQKLLRDIKNTAGVAGTRQGNRQKKKRQGIERYALFLKDTKNTLLVPMLQRRIHSYAIANQSGYVVQQSVT